MGEKRQRFAAGAALVGLLAGCSNGPAPDELHNVAIEQCQADLNDQLGGEAIYSDMTANGPERSDTEPAKYMYGVEGQVTGLTVSKGMFCLATYDSESETWEVISSAY